MHKFKIYFVRRNKSFNWYVSSGNGSNAYLTNYGNGRAYFNTYVPGCYGLTIEMTNVCGSSNDGITICAQDCFYSYQIMPNPATDKLNISFEKVDKIELLPDLIELISEKSMSVVKKIDVADIYNTKKFKNGNTIEADVKEFTRGVYYLRITNSRQNTKEQIKMIRIVLE